MQVRDTLGAQINVDCNSIHVAGIEGRRALESSSVLDGVMAKLDLLLRQGAVDGVRLLFILSSNHLHI
jgi:hypothetical protein